MFTPTSAATSLVRRPSKPASAAANGGLIGFTRVLRSDYRARGVTASVLILGAIAGAGQGQRTLDDMKQKTSAFMAPVEMVTKALLRALDGDKAELVVMPGPGRLMRALMDFFPGMGPWMNQQVGVNKTLREVQDFRRSQNLGV
jgi:NAD(P)-dependent dehydrogenase (short-subunit alcohol dehydrogenase family)